MEYTDRELLTWGDEHGRRFQLEVSAVGNRCALRASDDVWHSAQVGGTLGEPPGGRTEGDHQARPAVPREAVGDLDVGERPGMVPARMRLLRRMGFHQDRIYDECFQVVTVYFWRVWRGVRDVVLAYSECECSAYRVWDEDFDASNPFVVEPERRIWGRGGDFLDVTADLLTQPHPAAQES